MILPFVIAFVLASLTICLHVFTFEHWIWPKLGSSCFPTTPFTNQEGTKAYFRLTWHYFTAMWAATIGTLGMLGFKEGFAVQNVALAWYLGWQWIFVLISIFVNAYVALPPGASY